MQLEINQVLHGFRVTSLRPSAELAGTLAELTHEKT